ncbi:MAG TPA: hypothetical protein VE863_01640 [Pyrinomonadaceae bacterium]|jgi:hypothetical protein|nr:hypothetical protein [Pyrinomonadaceae bacterium]
MKIIFSLLGIICASVAVSAQQPTPTPVKQIVRPCCPHRLPRRFGIPARVNATTVAPQPSADFFVGEAKVDVTKDETVVRLAMAQHGSVLIELPASDGPRYIIPGDPEMATVDEKALEKNKRAIVVRPGSLFVSPPANRRAHSPAATVTVQMRSGLVVTFLFYPVEDLAQNVHRCVLSYNRDEVVARRRAAGLPVNLDNNIQERREQTGQSPAPFSISVDTSEDTKPADKTTPQVSPISNQTEAAVRPKEPATPQPTPADSAMKSEKPVATIPSSDVVQTFTHEALSQAIKKPSRFKNWTKAVHGVSLSLIRQDDPKNAFQVVVVAVRNNSAETLKLTPGSPDLLLQMVDQTGKPLNLESVKTLHIESSDSSGAIAPKSTAYYAIAFSSPVLGVNQELRIVVAQSNAADEPASIKLATSGR